MDKKVALFLLIALAPILAVAEDGKKAFFVSGGVGATAGITGAFAGGQAQIGWKPGFLGLALGARGDVGLSVPDAYVTPFAGLRLGWLALEGGLTIKAADAPEPAGYTEAAVEGASPFFRAGLSVPIGPVSIDLGARFMASDSYTALEVDDIGDVIAAPIAIALITVMGFVKIDLGLSYTLRF